MWFYDTRRGLDDVEEKLNACKKFGWSWSRDSTAPFRHTAIAIFMDDDPVFTINFSPAEGNGFLDALFQHCDHVITINPAYGMGDGTVTYFKPFEEFDVQNKSDKAKAMDLVKLLLSFDPGKYQLVMNNCRDHVKDVVEHFNASRNLNINLEEFHRELKKVKAKDKHILASAISIGVLAMGLVVHAAAYLATAMVVDGPVDAIAENSSDENDEK